ncbi:MAG: pantoate--beta-alanine ligase [Eggerthellaceae bacterium]|jgi:pantoate--beta-alanine ligase
MKVVETISEVRNQVAAWRKEGASVGLVTTMGYLHEGHASLIRYCRKENDKVVVTVFVNPTQFGPNEDLADYPRDIDHDLGVAEAEGADLVFHPSVEEMYDDQETFVSINKLSSTLCGVSRPIHFRGVCTVVSKFFNIVMPDRAYFGQKDAQQLAIIKKMVKDLNFNIEVIGCPTVREADGLAKSSRNAYLSPEERKAAPCLYHALEKGKEVIHDGISRDDLLAPMRAVLDAEELARIDYLEVVDALDMQPVERVDRDVLVALAVFIGKTRLIDNFSYEIDQG